MFLPHRLQLRCGWRCLQASAEGSPAQLDRRGGDLDGCFDQASQRFSQSTSVWSSVTLFRTVASSEVITSLLA